MSKPWAHYESVQTLGKKVSDSEQVDMIMCTII